LVHGRMVVLAGFLLAARIDWSLDVSCFLLLLMFLGTLFEELLPNAAMYAGPRISVSAGPKSVD